MKPFSVEDRNTFKYLSYILNIIAADVLATQAFRTTVVMISTYVCQNIPSSFTERVNHYYVFLLSLCMQVLLPFYTQVNILIDPLRPDPISRSLLTSIRNPIVEIRRSFARLISTMRFPILVYLYVETSLNGGVLI